MKVSELINELEKLEDKSMEIIVNDNYGGGYNMTGIEIVTFRDGTKKLEIR